MNINEQVIVVTGGASGLGQACVSHFLALGAKVAIYDLTSAANLAATDSSTEASAAAPGNVRRYNVDVTNEDAVAKAIEQTTEDLGEIRACINCAGIAPGGKTVGRSGALALEKFSKVIDINLIGTFNVLRLVAEKMCSSEPINDDGARGVIINTASVAAFDGQVGQAAYAASKGAIVSMTLPIARDLGPQGVRVNTIAPGVFGTPMMSAMSDDIKKPLEQAVQFPSRLGKPDEFAKLAAHIIENDYLNGETIRLDGGIRMAPR